MEGGFPRPYEVARVGLHELGIAGFGELEPLLWAFAPAHVGGTGWHKIQVMRVKPEDAQEPGELCEIADNDPLQVGHPAAAPVLEALRREQFHADEYINRGDDLAVLQDRCYGALDAWIERIFPITGDGDCRFRARDRASVLAGFPARAALHGFNLCHYAKRNGKLILVKNQKKESLR